MRHTYVTLSCSHIRLLILKPALKKDVLLHFSFQLPALSICEAISFTWGEPNLVFPLNHADGTHVCFTESLDLALQRIPHRLTRECFGCDQHKKRRDDLADSCNVQRILDVYKSICLKSYWNTVQLWYLTHGVSFRILMKPALEPPCPCVALQLEHNTRLPELTSRVASLPTDNFAISSKTTELVENRCSSLLWTYDRATRW